MSTTQALPPDLAVDASTGMLLCRRSRMASVLKISERQLDRLALSGDLPVRNDGWFCFPDTLDAYCVYIAAKAARPSPHDTTRRLQAEAIRGRMQREEPDLMMMVDALETTDIITAAFMGAMNLVEAEVAATDPDPDHIRRVVRPVFARTREKLTDEFAQYRAALVKGKRKGSRS